MGLSVYEFRRIFSFIIGCPISEYIRKRRLSLAALEIMKNKHTDIMKLSEKYVTYPEGTALPLDDKEMMWKINNMGAEYMTYNKFMGIENRTELSDEEKEVAKRFYSSL